MNFRNFFAELRRRNVYKVAVAYAVVAWLLIQAASILFPTFEAPGWVMKIFVTAIILGFPVALVIAWAFDLTPEGIKRADNLDEMPQPPSGKRAWIFVVIIAGAMSVGLFFLGRYTSRKQTGGSELPPKSIAVLPFENLSRDPDAAYFADGIQEEILTRLAKIADLKVISRTSTQRYKSSPENLKQIAEQLGVANILEGSVQRSGDAVRVNVQLIKAETDAHLWADTFDRKLTDIFAIESEIAKTIAETLQARLTGSEQKAIAVRPTENTEAHQLYLKGRFFWNKRTGPDFQKAIDFFKQAIEKDPGYALAYAGLADSYVLLSGFGAAAPQESFPLARTAAKKALEIDDDLAEAHASLAQALFFYDFNFEEADREFRRAIELSPNYATARQWYAESRMTNADRFDEAIAEIKHALELDPLSVIINTDVGGVLSDARRYGEAIDQLRKTLEMDQGFYYAHLTLGRALELKGLPQDAIAEYQRAVDLSNDPQTLACLGHLYGKIGKKDEALKILAQLRKSSEESYVSPYNLAIVQIGLGQSDEAIRLLEKTYDDRDGYSIAFIKTDQLLDPLRGAPRFESLVNRIFSEARQDPKRPGATP